MTEKPIGVPNEIVLKKIHLIRDQKVMLDSDLAELYGVLLCSSLMKMSGPL